MQQKHDNVCGSCFGTMAIAKCKLQITSLFSILYFENEKYQNWNLMSTYYFQYLKLEVQNWNWISTFFFQYWKCKIQNWKWNSTFYLQYWNWNNDLQHLSFNSGAIYTMINYKKIPSDNKSLGYAYFSNILLNMESYLVSFLCV